MMKCAVCEKEFVNEDPKKERSALIGHMNVHRKKSPKKEVKKARVQPQHQDNAVNVTAVRARSDNPNETLEDKIARLRKKRVPIGALDRKWSCPENDGYQYRVFNDDWMAKPGNIQAALEAGYDFVASDKEKEKPKIVGTNDNGTPIKGFLMRIPKVIFDEDQANKQKSVDRIDEQIKAGKFQQGAGDNRYIPAAGIKIMSDNRPPEI